MQDAVLVEDDGVVAVEGQLLQTVYGSRRWRAGGQHWCYVAAQLATRLTAQSRARRWQRMRASGLQCPCDVRCCTLQHALFVTRSVLCTASVFAKQSLHGILLFLQLCALELGRACKRADHNGAHAAVAIRRLHTTK